MSDRIALSVIVPTMGRPELARTLKSITGQNLLPEDEILVVADGADAAGRAKEILARNGVAQRRSSLIETEPTRYLGFRQRQVGLETATGSHILYMPDDDQYTPGAFDEIRQRIKKNPNSPLMFRMKGWGTTLWRAEEFCDGNVSDQMMVTPRIPEYLGHWKATPAEGARYQGDLDWMTETLSRWPGGVDALVWCMPIISIFNDGGNGRMGRM